MAVSAVRDLACCSATARFSARVDAVRAVAGFVTTKSEPLRNNHQGNSTIPASPAARTPERWQPTPSPKLLARNCGRASRVALALPSERRYRDPCR